MYAEPGAHASTDADTKRETKRERVRVHSPWAPESPPSAFLRHAQALRAIWGCKKRMALQEAHGTHCGVAALDTAHEKRDVDVRCLVAVARARTGIDGGREPRVRKPKVDRLAHRGNMFRKCGVAQRQCWWRRPQSRRRWRSAGHAVSVRGCWVAGVWGVVHLGAVTAIVEAKVESGREDEDKRALRLQHAVNRNVGSAENVRREESSLVS
jgi:hypothetical protein